MRKQHIFYGIALTVTGLLGLSMLVPSAAQDDLTPDMQTVQAGVQGLFTATAQASAYSTLALTVESVFQQAQTATAFASGTVVRDGTPTATPEDVATLTNEAQLLTTTVALPQTATALFQSLPGWTGEVASELVSVDGGTFQMGTTPQEITAAVNQCVNEQGGNCQLAFGADSIPQHSVTVSAFQIERTEVTYRQYLVFLNALGAGSHLSGCDGLPCAATRAENENSNILFDGFNYRVAAGALENYPASDITWYGADAYCRAIGRRLPTEAEWERAARGRDNFIYPWGNEWDSSLAKTSIPAGQPGTMPVGSFPSGVSSYGAFDLAGNVAEWVSDWYDPTFYSKPQASGLDPNGPGPGTLNQKVIRGGSWDAKPFFARSVHRQSDAPYYSGAWLGFRCAADFAPPGSTTTPPTRPTSTFTPTLIQPTPTPAPTSAHPTLTVTPT